MPLNLNISIEQLAETFRKLSKSDRARLKALLGEEWFEFKSDEETKTIQELLKISQKQHLEGKSRHFENIIEESRKKYGLNLDSNHGNRNPVRDGILVVAQIKIDRKKSR